MHFYPQSARYSIVGNPPAWFGSLLTPFLRQRSEEDVVIAWGIAPLASIIQQSNGVAVFNVPDAARTLRNAGFAYLRRFAILPSMNDPRWFIPLDSPRL